MSLIYELKKQRSNSDSKLLVNGISFIDKVISKLKIKFVLLLNNLKVPLVMREFEHIDKLTHQKISIKTQSLYTIISIDGRDYYFNRLNGKFDGTGSGFTCT